MTAETTVQNYYAALRAGDPLASFFRIEASTVKYGVSERLVGDEIEEGLREQTRTTHDWTVESHALRVTEHDGTAWFSDRIRMAWTDDSGERHDHDTRWSGTLVRDPEGDSEWKFVGMHVSVAGEA